MSKLIIQIIIILKSFSEYNNLTNFTLIRNQGDLTTMSHLFYFNN